MKSNEDANSTPEHQEKNLNELPSKTFKSKDFELTIYQGERKIIFRSSEIKDLSGTLYKAEFTLEELYELNDLFRGFKSIERIFNRFFQKLDESKIAIKKEDNKIIVTFIIIFMEDKDEAKISLIPEKPDINVTVMKLCDKVKEIDILKKEFENKIKELEKENQNLKDNIELYNQVYFPPEEITRLKSINIDSHILKIYDIILIEKGVLKNLKKKINKFTLLFRASKDGYRSSNFHSKCDGKNNTVTVVETTTGRRFGGFTDAQWDQSGNYKQGSNGFLFSLDFNEIYYNKDNNNNIYCYSSYGPTFGGGNDFYINDSCNSNSSGENSGSSYDTNGKKYPLSGNSSFLVRDYEVYQLELQ